MSRLIYCKDACKIIGPGKTKPTWFNEIISEPELTIDSYKDVRLYPTDILKPDNKIPYGFYNLKGQPLTDIYHDRGEYGNVFSSVKNKMSDKPIQNNELTGRSLYLGWLFPHYGHFLTESLSRAWCLTGVDPAKYDNYIFNYRLDKRENLVSYKYIWEILRGLGIDRKKVILPDRPYLVKNMDVPSQALILRRSISSGMSKVWSKIASTSTNPFRKVYISRIGIKRRELLNEPELENALKKKGYQILKPQNLSIKQQLKLYAETSILISPSGSGIHNAVFMPKHTKVMSLTTKDFIWKNELLCCWASQIDYSIYQELPSKNGSSWRINVDEFLSYI